MYTKLSLLQKKFRGLSLKIFNSIENNGNCNFDKNGEKFFIDNLLSTFKSSGGGYKSDI